jgi:hypothetical protein
MVMATHANEGPPINMKLLWESFRGESAQKPPAAKEDDLSLQVGPDVMPAPEPEVDEVYVPSRSGAWTIPMLCAGLAIIACTLLIPQADSNRRLAYEREKLKLDLQHIQKQSAVNDEFLLKLNEDPTLAERLAQRQMKVVREGTSVLELKSGSGRESMSPYLLVSVPPPAPMSPYKPVGGMLSSICRHPKSQLYLTGVGLMLVACGLVLGLSKGK